MEDAICTKCNNHYVSGGWHCWSGNKSFGFCNWNGEPHPKSKHWNYSYKRGKCVEFSQIEKISKKL